MLRGILIATALAISMNVAHAHAGVRIRCSTDGVITNTDSTQIDISRVLTFYLDDANAKLKSEDGLIANTISYSDHDVEANLRDADILPLPTWFGMPAKESGFVKIDRLTGQITFAVALLHGSEIESGICALEAKQEPHKF